MFSSSFWAIVLLFLLYSNLEISHTCPHAFISPLMVNVNGFAGGCTKTEEEEGPATEEDPQCYHGVGVCKWFNVRMGFGFLSMTRRDDVPLETPVDVFVHQVRAETHVDSRLFSFKSARSNG